MIIQKPETMGILPLAALAVSAGAGAVKKYGGHWASELGKLFKGKKKKSSPTVAPSTVTSPANTPTGILPVSGKIPVVPIAIAAAGIAAFLIFNKKKGR